MIDWAFIEAREGRRLVGYVPKPKSSKSGVTVGIGVDIGHMTDQDFLKLPISLQNKLEPYRHLVGLAAIQKLQALPLMLDTQEVNILDDVIFRSVADELREDYDRAWKMPGVFDSLPSQAQTVITSVAFQYGSLPAKTPHFWASVVAKDWRKAVAQLEDFGDDYHPRRQVEANLLKELVVGNTSVVA